MYFALSHESEKQFRVQDSAPNAVVISGKGKLKDTSYAGYAIVTVSTSTTSAYIVYTVDGSQPSCNLATEQPTTFVLSATAQVICFQNTCPSSISLNCDMS
jgi:hypothetical protein